MQTQDGTDCGFPRPLAGSRLIFDAFEVLYNTHHGIVLTKGELLGEITRILERKAAVSSVSYWPGNDE